MVKTPPLISDVSVKIKAIVGISYNSLIKYFDFLRTHIDLDKN